MAARKATSNWSTRSTRCKPQVQTLQGQVEELRHQLEEMKSRSKNNTSTSIRELAVWKADARQAPRRRIRRRARENAQPPDIALGGSSSAAAAANAHHARGRDANRRRTAPMTIAAISRRRRIARTVRQTPASSRHTMRHSPH